MSRMFVKALCAAVASAGVVLSAGCSSCGDCTDKPASKCEKKCDKKQCPANCSKACCKK